MNLNEINRVIEAEKAAEKIKTDAIETAKQRIAAANKTAIDDYNRVIASAEEQAKQLVQPQKTADSLNSEEINTIFNNAEKNMSSAVSSIVEAVKV